MLKELIPPSIESIRLKIAEFLGIVIYESDFIFLSIWSIIHLLNGFLIYYILDYLKVKRKLLILSFLVIAWEVIEFFLYGVLKSPLWIPESFVDVIWDVILGMLGGVIAWIILLLKK